VWFIIMSLHARIILINMFDVEGKRHWTDVDLVCLQ